MRSCGRVAELQNVEGATWLPYCNMQQRLATNVRQRRADLHYRAPGPYSSFCLYSSEEKEHCNRWTKAGELLEFSDWNIWRKY